jgi:general secretion pathway protein A
MYQGFYGLRESPFGLAPDPRYIFKTDSILEVFANLQYGLDNGKGLVVMTGEVGTGKTTVLRWIFESLDPSVLAAYIFNPLLSTHEFFELLADEFQLPPHGSKAAILKSLGQALKSRHTQGLRTVLVIDEAHLLPPHLFEEVRLLSNFETDRDKLLQIILCGQPKLDELFARPELHQLKQRINLKCSIKSLSEGETARYIDWRLRIAGAREPVFDREAIEIIYRFSGGIPRLVNNICDNAMLAAFSEAMPIVNSTIIDRVVDDLDLVPSARRHQEHDRELARSWSAGPDHTVGDDVIEECRPTPVRTTNTGAISTRGKALVGNRAGRSVPVPSAKFVLSSNQSESEDRTGFFIRVKADRTA